MAGTGQLVKLPVSDQVIDQTRIRRRLTRSNRETGVDSGCVIVRGIDSTMRAIYYLYGCVRLPAQVVACHASIRRIDVRLHPPRVR